jgi:hypothetical protein
MDGEQVHLIWSNAEISQQDQQANFACSLSDLHLNWDAHKWDALQSYFSYVPTCILYVCHALQVATWGALVLGHYPEFEPRPKTHP